MTSKTYFKHILFVFVLTMSFSCVSLAQIYSKIHVSDRLPKNYPNKLTPSFDKNKPYFGGYFGFNTATFTSTLRHDFSPAIGFAFGFELTYRRFCGFVNAGMSFGKTSREFFTSEAWLKGKPYSYGLTEISLGYLVFESEPWKICPFVGYSISEIAINETSTDISNATLSKFCTIVGISVDYKVYGDIFILSDTRHLDYLEFNVKTRLYGSYFNFNEDAKGCSINLMIGISLVKRPLMVRGFSTPKSSVPNH